MVKKLGPNHHERGNEVREFNAQCRERVDGGGKL